MKVEPDYVFKKDFLEKSPGKKETLVISHVTKEDIENNRKIWEEFIEKDKLYNKIPAPMGYMISKTDFLLQNPTINPELFESYKGAFLSDVPAIKSAELSSLVGENFTDEKLDKIDKYVYTILMGMLSFFVLPMLMVQDVELFSKVINLATVFFGFLLFSYVFIAGLFNDNKHDIDKEKKTVAWLDKDSLGVPGEK